MEVRRLPSSHVPTVLAISKWSLLRMGAEDGHMSVRVCGTGHQPRYKGLTCELALHGPEGAARMLSATSDNRAADLILALQESQAWQADAARQAMTYEGINSQTQVKPRHIAHPSAQVSTHVIIWAAGICWQVQKAGTVPVQAPCSVNGHRRDLC